MTIQEIANDIGISEGSVHMIVMDGLGGHEGVPKLLSLV